ncbi:type II and III secretion system protein family protein [Pararhodobacter sp. SW119]|uniref:type II and III secretion system protein family protein n=1 Tax=Pararhodobacter sp. SW119 TaxID=2780075 RepID=UPI001ADFB93B|nr:type II and III secretion system protein family protein [Pararhodobacter sp. SW119]
MTALTLGTGVGLGVYGSAQAETLHISSGISTQTIRVSMNRAVIVDSDVAFNELSIANPGIADISTLSDRSIYVLGKAPGRTTLTVLGVDGALIANIEVHVAPDVAEFRERLRQILPNEPIEVRTANDGVVLSGTVSSIGRLEAAMQLAERYAPDRVSNLMTVGGTQQVMLKVRFSEVQRDVAQQLGAGLAVGNGFAPLTRGATVVEGTGTLTARFNVGSLQFQVLLEALETNGLARTLSEPNLTALSGQEARFLAGGELPIPVPGEEGRIGIEYRPFGVELVFTPRVLDGNVINLMLNASVSDIDPTISVASAGFSIPGFRTRRTSTTVELRDGESFAIAGLLQDDFFGNNRQVPWLGQLPVIGALFRSTDFRRNQSELVIFVTAHLVTPTRGEALVMPTDRVRLPTEADLFLRGRVEGTGPASEVARQDFRGGYGYIMD